MIERERERKEGVAMERKWGSTRITETRDENRLCPAALDRGPKPAAAG